MSKRKALVTRAGRGSNAKVTSVTPDGLRVLEALASQGNDQRTMAKALGISGAVLRHLRDGDEQVREAWDRGLGALASELTHHLLRAARKGNITAAIYLTKARLGWREGDAPEGNRQAVQVNINLPSPLEREEYLRMVTGHTVQGDG